MNSKAAVGLRAVCESCTQAPKFVPVSKAKQARQKSNSVASEAAPEAERSKLLKLDAQQNSQAPEQTIASARYVARAWRDTAKKFNEKIGVSPEHSGRFFRLDEPHKVGTEAGKPDSVGASDYRRLGVSTPLQSVRNAISFGLLVFLVGQALTLVAFVSGHAMAWSIGFLFSIGGITVSLLSTNEAFRRLEERVSETGSKRSTKGKSPLSAKSNKP